MSLLGDVPLVALTPLPNEEWVRDVTEIGVTVCVSPRLWDSPALPALVVSAIQRGRQQAESRRLVADQQRRKSLDLADARALLQLQQQSLLRIQERSGISRSADSAADWQSRYHELLRVSLITGLPGLIAEIQRFVQQLTVDGISPTAVLTTHIAETERLLEGLGGRSSRQVASRATLLAVETLAELAEQYRRSAQST
ncbi:MAG: hypothetical protein B7Z55_04140 [Planctomycetales bacterium 12-60-4]|nr:MAG: hypothetical protein B7Z55_04140 [Planctomycetales bacterium 12-60-4]